MGVRQVKGHLGRTAIWMLTACVASALLPGVIVAFVVAAAFYPDGSSIPYLTSFDLLPVSFVIFLVAPALPIVAVVAGIASKSWRPVGLGLAAFAGLITGTVASGIAFAAAQDYALKKINDRSAGLVRAIENYQRTYGRWPEKLDALVPIFLAEVPKTGIESSPNYYYSADPGACSTINPWHLSISIVEFDVKYLVYCPLQDYDALERDGSVRIRNLGAWVLWSM